MTKQEVRVQNPVEAIKIAMTLNPIGAIIGGAMQGLASLIVAFELSNPSLQARAAVHRNIGALLATLAEEHFKLSQELNDGNAEAVSTDTSDVRDRDASNHKDN